MEPEKSTESLRLSDARTPSTAVVDESEYGKAHVGT
jgi:hypothetical protein